MSPIVGYTHSTNEWAAAFRNAAPDRILAFGGFDPRLADNPVAEINRALNEFALDGIKIHPPHQGINVNDYRSDPDTRELDDLATLYKRCADQEIPIMVHTGTSIFSGARSRYADPMPIDDVAVDYPNLTIIMAHGGRPMYTEEAWFLLRRHDNLYQIFLRSLHRISWNISQKLNRSMNRSCLVAIGRDQWFPISTRT
ncbi:amidohydrolase family protein [Halalkalicoccus sp. GCM10025322]|uniref:amidohydrolase family protein n=1 Tax=Halalkalicoccus TaxID=332246 RepID=UPI003613A72D